MRMYDLIEKKKTGHTLTTEEINYMILGYTNGCLLYTSHLYRIKKCPMW